MDFSLKSIPVRKPDIIFRKIEDEYILVPMSSSYEDVEYIFNLNTTGADIWDKIDGCTTIEGIIEKLKKEYGGQDNLETDVIEFIKELFDAKMIDFINENS